jgi:hypothetical protein
LCVDLPEQQTALQRIFLDDRLFARHIHGYFRGMESKQGKINRVGMLCDALSDNEFVWHKCYAHHLAANGVIVNEEMLAVAYQEHQERENTSC